MSNLQTSLLLCARLYSSYVTATEVVKGILTDANSEEALEQFLSFADDYKPSENSENAPPFDQLFSQSYLDLTLRARSLGGGLRDANKKESLPAANKPKKRSQSVPPTFVTLGGKKRRKIQHEEAMTPKKTRIDSLEQESPPPPSPPPKEMSQSSTKSRSSRALSQSTQNVDLSQNSQKSSSSTRSRRRVIDDDESESESDGKPGTDDDVFGEEYDSEEEENSGEKVAVKKTPANWSIREQELVHQGVSHHWYNWKAVADYVGTKNEAEVKEFFDSKRGTKFFPIKKWSLKEIEIAKEQFVPEKMDYSRIEKLLPNKTRHQITKWYTKNRKSLLISQA